MKRLNSRSKIFYLRMRRSRKARVKAAQRNNFPSLRKEKRNT
jgi:hypothetical protein